MNALFPRFLLLGCLWLAWAGEPLPVAAAGEAAPEKIKVVSWNLEWFPGGFPQARKSDQAYQMRKAQEAVKVINPDILLVQEVKDWKSFEELCSAAPGLKVAVLSAFDPSSPKLPPQNVGIAAKFPAHSAWAELWAASGDHPPPRGFSFAALDAGDRYLLCYSVHLKSNRGNAEGLFEQNVSMRSEASRQLLAHAQAMQKVYGKLKPAAVIIGGDFNTTTDDPLFAQEKTLKIITDSGYRWVFENVQLANRVTIPGDDIRGFPDATFDHIFTFGLGKTKARAVKTKDVSDHNPVEAVIMLNPEPAPSAKAKAAAAGSS